MVKDDIFVSFLSFGEKHSFPIKYDVGSRFFVHTLDQVEKVTPLSLVAKKYY